MLTTTPDVAYLTIPLLGAVNRPPIDIYPSTSYDKQLPSLLIPVPKADHDDRFHLAILFARLPPAVPNVPVAYKLLLPSVTKPNAGVFKPLPKAAHDDPFHLAIRNAEIVVSTTVKTPPTYKLPAVSVAKEITLALGPVPTRNHDVPFHLATRTAGEVNRPPAYKLPFRSSAKAFTVSFTPLPKADHDEPSHLAILFAELPPAVVNKPPAYNKF